MFILTNEGGGEVMIETKMARFYPELAKFCPELVRLFSELARLRHKRKGPHSYE